MGQVDTNDVNQGMKLEVDGQPFVVTSAQFVKPGKGQAFCRMKLKNMITARVMERTFRSNEKIDLADIDETKMRMLYQEQDGAVFMHDETFEQITIPHTNLEGVKDWLKDDLVYDIVFWRGEPVTVEPPTFLDLEVTECDPGVRGDTASGRVLKPAVTETGAKVQVPIFIDQGEIIRFDTRTGEYVSRVKD